MSRNEEHKWMTYFIWAVIIAIFGMVIYMVTMDEKKEDRYWLSLNFVQDTASLDLPTYPTGSTGTLDEGIKVVRDAVADKVATLDDVDFNVPHQSKWKLSINPTGTSGSNDIVYTYSFPASSELKTTSPYLNELVENTGTVGNLFNQSSDEVIAWANTTFGNASSVIATLNYGTRDSIKPPNLTV